MACGPVPTAYNGAAMVQLLEEAINKVKRLSPAEQEAIAEVILAELKQAEWDKQIEEDLKAGRLDKLIQDGDHAVAIQIMRVNRVRLL